MTTEQAFSSFLLFGSTTASILNLPPPPRPPAPAASFTLTVFVIFKQEMTHVTCGGSIFSSSSTTTSTILVFIWKKKPEKLDSKRRLPGVKLNKTYCCTAASCSLGSARRTVGVFLGETSLYIEPRTSSVFPLCSLSYLCVSSLVSSFSSLDLF